MKKVISAILALCLLLSLCIPVSATSIQDRTVDSLETMRTALIIICALLVILLICCMLALISASAAKKSKRHKKNPGTIALRIVIYAVTILTIACTFICAIRYIQAIKQTDITNPPAIEAPDSTVEDPETNPSTSEPPTTPSSEPSIETPPENTEPPTTTPVLPVLSPYHTENTDPANWGIDWQLQVGGIASDAYQSADSYNFTWAEDYFTLSGVPTFRSNNYRTGGAYGTVQLSDNILVKKWKSAIGSYNNWSGMGWTGQPLCMQWDDELKAIMNLYPEKKAKEDLVEVIAPTLDGYIYFYDMEDGSYTRDRLWIGMNFKGTASLDPRGYPILYAGSGDKVGNRQARMFAISLIDFTILMGIGGPDSFSHRTWYAFDSSPMISGETDTIFWPGESGMIYSIKLNTQYDQETATLTMDPDVLVKARYSTNTRKTRWFGFESSSIIVGQYMFIGDNGGYFFCIDLNTMELVWAQFVQDDVNATPVFEWGSDGQGYLYVGSSTEYSKDTAYIHKLNATNGEIIWSKSIDNVAFNVLVSGGVLSSPVLGKPGTDLEGMIFFSVSKVPDATRGILMALDTQTGNVIWEKTLDSYAWSSPVGIYTESGKGYLVLADSSGNINLMEGATGTHLYAANVGSIIEATPVVFNNMLVVGTRDCRVWGIEIK